MNALFRGLVAAPLLAIALGAAVPTYASTIVEGQVGQNLSGVVSHSFSTGPQTTSGASDNLNWNFTCSTCSGYGLSASGAAKVVNGALGASSTMTVTGTPGGALLATASSDAVFGDMLTITGGTAGTSGVLQLTYSLDGVISSSGTGLNSSSAFLFLDAASSYQYDNQGVSSGGFVEIDNNGTRNDTVTFYVPFTYATAISTDLNLDASSVFVAADSTPYTASVNYYNTAALTSALVFDTAGAQNTAAQIGSADGLSYGPNGIAAAVPEPSSWALLIVGFGAAGAALRGRRRGSLTPAPSRPGPESR
ncbi:MAG: PEPxxWA-CTERM sorting domain-containing protein [Caulobacterales bacterium]|jgi:hypothetical protein